jgi:hypothetical protein
MNDKTLFTKEDFYKMTMLTETSFKLKQESNEFYQLMERAVNIYLIRNKNVNINTISDLSIDFTWSHILVSWKTKQFDIFGDGDNYDNHVLRLTYKEVFGWEHTKEESISTKWGYDYIQTTIDGFKPKPTPINYDI